MLGKQRFEEMNKMKIGTITFHCAYNFGSALQTYALKKYLTDLGHDVHVIDYRSEELLDFPEIWYQIVCRGFAVPPG